MDNNKKHNKQKPVQFTLEYNKLMKSGSNQVSVPVKWREKGDMFEKFTMYESYTPVKISNGTSPLK
ncbi:MAG: hypothetical protein KDC37_05795 [Flavobacteriales bacterium]|nr:hypothetical protein [Flavobacteriales bacterium]